MNGEARALLNSELLKELLDKLEQENLNAAVNADIKDDETRRARLGEVRAIRSFRTRLQALLRDRAGPENPVV